MPGAFSKRFQRVELTDLIVALRIGLATVSLGLIGLYTINSTTHGAAIEHYQMTNARVKQALLGTVVTTAVAQSDVGDDSRRRQNDGGRGLRRRDTDPE